MLKDLPAGEGERVARELARADPGRGPRRRRTSSATCGWRSALSIGVGLYRQGTTTTAADLLHDAETWLSRPPRAPARTRCACTGAVSARRCSSPDDAFDPARRAAAELDRILATPGAVTAVYQPIVELASGEVVGYEALARGPEGSPLHRPDRLFAAAAAAGRVVELDWACRPAAVRGALDAGLGRGASLFLNSRAGGDRRGAARRARRRAVGARRARAGRWSIEITERAITARPAELVRVIAEQRAAAGTSSRWTTSAPTSGRWRCCR